MAIDWTQGGRNRKTAVKHSIIFAVLLCHSTVLGSGPASLEIEKYVSLTDKCVHELIEHESTNISEGTLVPERSYVHVNQISVSELVSIHFTGSAHASTLAEHKRLDHYPVLYCQISNEGKIIHLSSPETVGDEVVVTEFVPLDEEDSDRVYEHVMDSVHSGEEVFSTFINFRMVGSKLTHVGEVRRIKIEPDEFRRN